MTIESRFRALLVASMALGLLGAFIDLAVPTLIPPELAAAHDDFAGSDLGMSAAVTFGVASVVLVVGGLVSLYGLWFFRRWGPRLAVGITVLAYLIYPFLGYNLSSGLASTLTDVSTLLWGIVLAMAFLPPLKERFMHAEVSPPAA